MSENKPIFDLVPSATGKRSPDPEWGIFLRVDGGFLVGKHELTLDQAMIWNERLTDWIHHAVRNARRN